MLKNDMIGFQIDPKDIGLDFEPKIIMYGAYIKKRKKSLE